MRYLKKILSIQLTLFFLLSLFVQGHHVVLESVEKSSIKKSFFQSTKPQAHHRVELKSKRIPKTFSQEILFSETPLFESYCILLNAFNCFSYSGPGSIFISINNQPRAPPFFV